VDVTNVHPASPFRTWTCCCPHATQRPHSRTRQEAGIVGWHPLSPWARSWSRQQFRSEPRLCPRKAGPPGETRERSEGCPLAHNGHRQQGRTSQHRASIRYGLSHITIWQFQCFAPVPQLPGSFLQGTSRTTGNERNGQLAFNVDPQTPTLAGHRLHDAMSQLARIERSSRGRAFRSLPGAVKSHLPRSNVRLRLAYP